MLIKIATVIGCRPQFVKASALSRTFMNQSNNLNKIKEIIIHTGQHFDKNMSENFFKELNIPLPDYNCSISGGTHGENTGRMLEKIEKILIDLKPDYLLVYGDTNSTLAGALAASKLCIPVIHIEAGLRSFNKNQPEEQNRLITDHLSEICFAPTDEAINNLINEGISKKKIFLTGDVMEDMNHHFSNKAKDNLQLIKKFNLNNSKYALLTIHREENTNNPFILENILKTLNSLNIEILFPLHPRTKFQINKFNLNKYLNNFKVIDPVGFVDMATLEKFSKIIITDSGGVQKEAYFHQVPCITLRKETEWIELISSGWNRLANPEDNKEIVDVFNKQMKFDISKKRHPYYGQGNASQIIYDHIISLK